MTELSTIPDAGDQMEKVTKNFPIIEFCLGKVEVADAIWEGLPALWFGNSGRGVDAPTMEHNRPAHDGETLALFTFLDIRGVEVIERACARIRERMEADSAPTQESEE